MDAIRSAVKRMYEAFPYPHYALWLPIRWQEGYMGQSAVSDRLNNQSHPGWHKKPRNILIAGSGDMQPFVLRHLEPWFHRICCVDLSQRSLSRARLRLGWRQHHTSFVASDIDAFLRRSNQQFDHIDSYGVLHHLSTPSTTLRLMRQRLTPDGTLRIMVYNERSRRWIRHVQRAMDLLQIDPYKPEDRRQARELLEILARESPSYRRRLQAIGSNTLRHDSRLVDTFLHRREARIPIRRWFTMFAEAGLEPYALFDRYGELDDLPCPLTHMPSMKDLEARAADGRFENNLEIFLRIKNPYHPPSPTGSPLPESKSAAVSLFFKPYPRSWFDYPETSTTPRHTRWQFWMAYLRHLRHPQNGTFAGRWLSQQPLARLQRLARLGAMFATQMPNDEWRQKIAAPMASEMETPHWPNPTHCDSEVISQWIQNRLYQVGKNTSTRNSAVLKRLQAGEVQ